MLPLHVHGVPEHLFVNTQVASLLAAIDSTQLKGRRRSRSGGSLKSYVNTLYGTFLIMCT